MKVIFIYTEKEVSISDDPIENFVSGITKLLKQRNYNVKFYTNRRPNSTERLGFNPYIKKCKKKLLKSREFEGYLNKRIP